MLDAKYFNAIFSYVIVRINRYEEGRTALSVKNVKWLVLTFSMNAMTCFYVFILFHVLNFP